MQRRGPPPPVFDPNTQFNEALDYCELGFPNCAECLPNRETPLSIERGARCSRTDQDNGFCCVTSLSKEELAALNTVCDEWVNTRGPEIDVPGQGQVNPNNCRIGVIHFRRIRLRSCHFAIKIN